MKSTREIAAMEGPGSVRGDKAEPLALRIGFWACTAIAVAVVARRLLALAFPPRSGPAPLAALDTVFASHAALTLAHILPALLFVAVAPFALMRRQAAWAERAIYPLGAIVGATAYAMSGFAVGGWVERAAVLVFNTWFLVSLLAAYRFRRSGDDESSRRWLVRAVVVLLGIATTRPVMGVFFAISAATTHWTPQQFFGYAFWIGFSINALVVELWLRSAARKRLRGA